MRLAVRSGSSPTQIEQTWSETDFDRLRVFDLIDPIGDERQDMLVALLRSTLIACSSGKSVPVSDLIPDWGRHLDEFLPRPVGNSRAVIALVKSMLSRAGKHRKPPSSPAKPVLETNNSRKTRRSKIS